MHRTDVEPIAICIMRGIWKCKQGHVSASPVCSLAMCTFAHYTPNGNDTPVDHRLNWNDLLLYRRLEFVR